MIFVRKRRAKRKERAIKVCTLLGINFYTDCIKCFYKCIPFFITFYWIAAAVIRKCILQ